MNSITAPQDVLACPRHPEGCSASCYSSGRIYSMSARAVRRDHQAVYVDVEFGLVSGPVDADVLSVASGVIHVAVGGNDDERATRLALAALSAWLERAPSDATADMHDDERAEAARRATGIA